MRLRNAAREGDANPLTGKRIYRRRVAGVS
ncbi:hypothetical protein OIU92_22850 [Escherichia coli]|nr:hypothetical protein [Escherichia coli]